MEFIYEPEFWVAVSFFIFIGVLVYLGVHKKVANELDARALRIRPGNVQIPFGVKAVSPHATL